MEHALDKISEGPSQMSSWRKKRRVMYRYDLTAGMYEKRYADEQAAKIAAALAYVNLNNEGFVLDAGCGTGLLLKHVWNKVHVVVGIDLSRRTLQQARKRAKIYPSVLLIQADADHMPFRDGFFSQVFAVTLIQNAPNPIQTLREVKRVARKNAEIVVTGLKRVFSHEHFMKLVGDAGLKLVASHFERLPCYVAVCVKNSDT